MLCIKRSSPKVNGYCVEMRTPQINKSSVSRPKDLLTAFSKSQISFGILWARDDHHHRADGVEIDYGAHIDMFESDQL